MADLVLASDADLLAYHNDEELTGRESFLLRAASEIVRQYCGWHIAPSVDETVSKLPIGSRGLIMLPSLWVTDVASVTVDGTALDTTAYAWFRQGYIEGYSPHCVSFTVTALAEVVMSHGYDECPLPIKSVIFELMVTANETPSNNVDTVTAPGYSIKWGDGRGATLSAGQQDRLNGYRIGGLK